ncbi:unnamed protein product, partial [Amoebophrya sp. A25]
ATTGGSSGPFPRLGVVVERREAKDELSKKFGNCSPTLLTCSSSHLRGERQRYDCTDKTLEKSLRGCSSRGGSPPSKLPHHGRQVYKPPQRIPPRPPPLPGIPTRGERAAQFDQPGLVVACDRERADTSAGRNSTVTSGSAESEAALPVSSVVTAAHQSSSSSTATASALGSEILPKSNQGLGLYTRPHPFVPRAHEHTPFPDDDIDRALAELLNVAEPELRDLYMTLERLRPGKYELDGRCVHIELVPVADIPKQEVGREDASTSAVVSDESAHAKSPPHTNAYMRSSEDINGSHQLIVTDGPLRQPVPEYLRATDREAKYSFVEAH